jgi:hypothetical protein
MSEELGKIEKPEAEQYKGRKKLYLVPLLYSWQDAPPEYAEKLNLYWQQVREQVANLESRIGSLRLVYHESVTAAGEEGLKILERLNPSSYRLVREKCLMGAQLEVIEDRELVEETMDWERHLIMGFLSDKVARVVSEFFSEASRKRWEHISQRIKDTLKDGETAMLIIREGHRVQFPPDVEVFIVAPPALNEIQRWLRERQEKAERADAEAEEEVQEPAPKTVDDLRAEVEKMKPETER